MRKKFTLDIKEQLQRKVLNVLIVFIILVIVKGIFNQSNNINQDDILAPLFLGLTVVFCAIYSFNAFTSGNIVRNWSSLQIFSGIQNQLKNKTLMSDEKATRITIKIFGAFTVILALVCIIIAIHSFYTGKW